MKSLFVVSLLLLGSLSSQTTFAQDGRLLTVKGKAEVEVPPDFVRLEVLISAEGENVEKAKSDVDSRTRSAVKAIESFEIADDDMSFGGLSVERNYEYDRNDNERLIGYFVGRTIELRLRKFEDYEQLVQLLVEAGIDELQDVEVGVDDKSVLERAALEGAAKAARLKAEAIAAGLGVTLGLPVEVGGDRLMPTLTLRQQRANDYQMQEMVVTAARRTISDPMLFVPGNISVNGVVWVRFEIEGK